MGQSAPDNLERGAATYRQRNPLYGNNYKQIGTVLKVLFRNGVPTMDEAGWNRYAAWMALLQKTIRYAISLERDGSGHADSAHDAMVYAAMLEELTDE